MAKRKRKDGSPMGHLLRFRKGWENERLAAFLLSRFSFVAQPASVADDVGSDFFCTIFEVFNQAGMDFLAPRKSFAIQIKSGAEEFNVDNKIDYLKRLELPFFIGVVNQPQQQMTIYSAEFIPLLIALHAVDGLWLTPVDKSAFHPDKYCSAISGNVRRLQRPSVMTISVADDRATLSKKVSVLLHLCARVHANIATKVSNEHIYEIDGQGVYKLWRGRDLCKSFGLTFSNALPRFSTTLTGCLIIIRISLRLKNSESSRSSSQT